MNCKACEGVAGLNRPNWSPVKGSSARVSPVGSATVVRQRFFWIRNRHRHHLSATLLDGPAGNGWARLLRCDRERSGGGFSNAGYEPHPSCGDCPLTGSAIVVRQRFYGIFWPLFLAGSERIVETRAELPFIGDQVVCLSHDQAARSGTRQSPEAELAGARDW